MSLVNLIRERVEGCGAIADQLDLNDALKDAERLADLYADVRPEPFVVPIERFVGLPILGESKLNNH